MRQLIVYLFVIAICGCTGLIYAEHWIKALDKGKYVKTKYGGHIPIEVLNHINPIVIEYLKKEEGISAKEIVDIGYDIYVKQGNKYLSLHIVALQDQKFNYWGKGEFYDAPRFASSCTNCTSKSSCKSYRYSKEFVREILKADGVEVEVDDIHIYSCMVNVCLQTGTLVDGNIHLKYCKCGNICSIERRRIM